MAKDKDYIKLIGTAKWQRLRRAKLSANPECERCLEEKNRPEPATEVHHVIPVEHGLTYREKETLMFDFGNLRSLCHDCHVKTHNEMGRSGKKQNRRKTKEQLERFVKKFF
jgi:5-methylcytosine-specific restriction protein A